MDGGPRSLVVKGRWHKEQLTKFQNSKSVSCPACAVAAAVFDMGCYEEAEAKVNVNAEATKQSLHVYPVWTSTQ